MDNMIVGITGAACYVMAQTATNWFDSITPLGIVALVVYYFLIKFDRKLDTINATTKDIDDRLKTIEKENHND